MTNVQKYTIIDSGVQQMLFTKETGKVVLVNIVLNIIVLEYFRLRSLLKVACWGIVHEVIIIFWVCFFNLF